MKVSKQEIDAAYYSLLDSCLGTPVAADISLALKAAYKVRSARKQARRERQRKEKDKHVISSLDISRMMNATLPEAPNKQVVESVKPADNDKLRAGIIQDIVGSTASGSYPFGVGDWEMQNGEKAEIKVDHGCLLTGNIGPTAPCNWYMNGMFRSIGFGKIDPVEDYRLIRPWPKAPLTVLQLAEDER